ncbi:MAG: hypothetical protein K2W94_02240 [Alphaproteobacteria bacterium]|nr:hypothetical protein [Alphaproteobacteria bacterium]
MKKIFCLIIFGLLAITNPIFAMDEADDPSYDDDVAATVRAPGVIYFESIPETQDIAEDVLSKIIINNDDDTTGKLRLVLSYIYDPTQDVMPNPDFDFNDFARKLAACENIYSQRKLLTDMELDYREEWED